jgi:signal transduction histidine kinase
MLFLIVAIVWVFQTTVYHSVRHLVNVMNRFKSGEASARADENLIAEFGELARHFNGMLEEIQGFNDHLTQQVDVATQELTTRNAELQALNIKLYETQKRLMQAERLALVGQLTATFAHEIGSPLSAISTHLQILLEDPMVATEVRGRLRLANEQIDRVCAIVESLLKSTRQPCRRIPVELEEIVRKVILVLQPTLESRHIVFEFKGTGGPFLIEGDPDQLQQLFLNLFTNSLDAMQSGGSLAVQIRQCTSRKSYRRYYQIIVRDSGCGIPADRLDHIFEPFFTTKEFGKGTGLGLTVTKGIVRQHRGQISVTSSLGKGTCFTIRLPEGERAEVKIQSQSVMAAKEVGSE